ncbi:MAG TPA: hypothetical protein VHW09_27425 [Bryobacteraceae bacterium]|jgi:hypothetical protein|nr:hypothetical protein [Bryobacteraceae bacterium]
MIRIAIIEDQRELREGLRELIDGAEGFCCTAVFGSVEEMLPRSYPAMVLVVLTDSKTINRSTGPGGTVIGPEGGRLQGACHPAPAR